MRLSFRIFSFYLLAALFHTAQAQEIFEIPHLKEDPVSGEFKPITEEEDGARITDDSLTYSVSKSFRVSGADGKFRGEVASGAEALLDELRKELKIKEDKELKTPIRIRLVEGVESGKGSAYRKTFGLEPSGGFYVQLAVNTKKLERDGYRRALMEVLTYSYALSEVLNDSEITSMTAHPWFIDGMLELLSWETGTSRTEDYLALSQNPKSFELDTIFDISEERYSNLDQAQRRMYKVACGAFLMSLVSNDGGEENTRNMLSELALFAGDSSNILKKHYPPLNTSKNGIRVAWLLQLSLMSVPKLTDVMTISETEEALAEALRFDYFYEGKQESVAIEAFDELFKLDEAQRRAVIDTASKKLVQVDKRYFPDYRPMLVAYGTVLNSLTHGKVDGAAEMVEGLSEERELKKRAAIQVRDYLDWYEINHANEVEGNFSDATPNLNVGDEIKIFGDYLDVLDGLYVKSP